MSSSLWKDFQLNAPLPNTELGSAHDGLDFSCRKCRTPICYGNEIAILQRGAVWTNCELDTLVSRGPPIWNKYKNCNMREIICKNCGASLGNLYPQRFNDAPPGQLFPCVKLTYRRVSKGVELNETVLNICTREKVNAVLAGLTPSSDQTGGGGARVNTSNYDRMMKAPTANTSAPVAPRHHLHAAPAVPATLHSLGITPATVAVSVAAQAAPQQHAQQAPSAISWKDFQLNAPLPNTILGSAHDGLDFSCYKCGQSICDGEDIAMLHLGAVWTYCELDTLDCTSAIKYKNCNVRDACCTNCNASLGIMFPRQFDILPQGLSFPCVMLTYKKDGKREEANHTALNISTKAGVDNILARLPVSSDLKGASVGMSAQAAPQQLRQPTQQTPVRGPSTVVATAVSPPAYPAPMAVAVGTVIQAVHVAPLPAPSSAPSIAARPPPVPSLATDAVTQASPSKQHQPISNSLNHGFVDISDPTAIQNPPPVLPSQTVTGGTQLRQVDSYADTNLTHVAIYLFTGNNRLVLELKEGNGVIPSGPILSSDYTPIDAAKRLMIALLGLVPPWHNLRRFLWNENTAVYTLHTGYMLHSDRVIFVRVDNAIVSPVISHLRTMLSKVEWQCYVDPGVWQTYDTEIQTQLRTAQSLGQPRCAFTFRGIAYEIKFLDLQQCRKDGVFNTKRHVRSVLVCNFCS